MFTRKSLASQGTHNVILKYLTMFFLGVSCVVLTTQAFNITTSISNAVQYINRIVLTSDGSNQGTTGIVLDGTNGNASFSGSVGINQGLSVTGSSSFNGNVGIKQNLTVTGNLNVGTLTSSNAVTHNININGHINLDDGYSDGYLYANGGNLNLTSVRSNAGYGGGVFIRGGDTSPGYGDGGGVFIRGGSPLGSPGNYGNVILGVDWDDNGNVVKIGEVGIGTDTPDAMLDVDGSTHIAGDVGIGTNSPSQKLDVHGNIVLSSGDSSLSTSNDGSLTIFAQGRVTTGDGSDINIRGGTGKAGGTYQGAGGNVYINGGKGPTSQFDGNVSLAWDGSHVVGHVNIGTADLGNGFMLTVGGSGLFSGPISAPAFYYSSDRRYKENITLITDPLQKILGLNGYTFNWKAGGRPDIGVIAQEVEKVFPQAVSTNADGYKSVEYGNLVAPLIEAVKALYHKNVDQEARIETLEQQVKDIQTTLHQ